MAKQPAIPIAANWVRVTMFIKTADKTISEAHWYNSTGVSLNAVLTLFQPIANARDRCLSADGHLIEVRASAENIYKDSKVSTANAFTTANPFGSENVGNDCINIRVDSGSLYRKVLFFGAVPDENIIGGQYDPTATFTPGSTYLFGNNLKAYLNLLVGPPVGSGVTPPPSSWGFLAINKDPGQSPRCDINKIIMIVGPPNVVQIQTVQPHQMVDGDVVRLSRVPGASAILPWNQLWRINFVDANNFTLQNFPAFTVLPTSILVGGKAQRQSKIFVPYDTYAIESACGTRKRGGRTFLPLGRSKRKNTVGY